MFQRRILVAVFGAVLALAACAGDAPPPGGTPTTAGEPTTGEPTPGEPTTGESNPVVLVSGNEPLQAGTYLLDLDAGGTAGERFPLVRLTVPEGWENLDGWGVRYAPDTERWMAVTFWDVGEVYRHPCQWIGERIQPGPTVHRLAEVLASRPLRNATEPARIHVGGYAGLELTWSVPDGFDFNTCDTSEAVPYFESWMAAPGSWSTDRYQQGPSQVDRLWILDVDGRRLVIDGFFMPGASDEERAMLDDVMASIRFGPAT